MNVLVPQRMTVADYLAWCRRQPSGRYELIRGRPAQQPAERALHLRVKSRVFMALCEAVRQAGVKCEVLPDGATVQVSEHEAFEPDALVYAGEPVPDDAIVIPEPLIVVEVLSQSTTATDTGRKLAGYFAVPSLRHYLIVDAEPQLITHHRRRDDAGIETSIIERGSFRLDPPGLVLAHAAFFASA
jgi:Uma2 family endonuclease